MQTKKIITRADMEPEKKRMSPAELPIWRYIADHQPVTVRQVADYVSGTSG